MSRTGRMWTAKAEDYTAIKSLIAGGVPLSLITQTMDEICEKNPGKRITTFRYFVPAIEERWVLEQAKRTPPKPLTTPTAIRDGPRSSRISVTDIQDKPIKPDMTEELIRRYEQLKQRFGPAPEGDVGGGANRIGDAACLS